MQRSIQHDEANAFERLLRIQAIEFRALPQRRLHFSTTAELEYKPCESPSQEEIRMRERLMRIQSIELRAIIQRQGVRENLGKQELQSRYKEESEESRSYEIISHLARSSKEEIARTIFLNDKEFGQKERKLIDEIEKLVLKKHCDSEAMNNFRLRLESLKGMLASQNSTFKEFKREYEKTLDEIMQTVPVPRLKQFVCDVLNRLIYLFTLTLYYQATNRYTIFSAPTETQTIANDLKQTLNHSFFS